MNFSVLMSVYKKENPLWFKQAVESVFYQSVLPNEVVIVQDGKLTPELYAVCDELKKNHREIKCFPLAKNVGLGTALKYGVEVCKNELIARMDTDDIAVNNRFELQLQKFKEQPTLDICGGIIAEFYNNPEDEVSIRDVPYKQEKIVQYCKKRNPFNHMTVMFKKSAVLAAGNYEDFPLMEDYWLWYRMIKNKCNMCNLDKILVKARIGNGMYERRSGWDYFCQERILYGAMKDDGFINKAEFISILALRCIARCLHPKLMKIIYERNLRK